MKITYNTNFDHYNKEIYIRSNTNIYSLCSDEPLQINHENNENMLIYTQQTKSLSVCNMIVLFIKKIVVNIFNVIIMNLPKYWFTNLEPFTISSVTNIIEKHDVSLKYIPTKITRSPISVQKPQLLVNNRAISTKVFVDVNAIKTGFIAYCFDLISLWLYGSLLLTFIFAYSGKMTNLIVMSVYGLTILGITIPIVFRIRKCYREKKQLIFILENIC